MDADGARQRRLHRDIVAKSSRGWCAGNKLIAFAARVDHDIDIFAVEAGGAPAARLTSSRGEDRDPSWSPDCQHLAFSSARDGNAEIYVMRADGGDVRRLTSHAGSDSSPAWSPDGSLIAFVSSRSGAGELYAIRPDGQDLRQLTHGGGSTRDAPRWSPDGSRIAYQIDRGKNYDIGIVRLSDGRRGDVARSAAYDGMYAWAPDNRHLAFVSARHGTEALYVADADGQAVQRVTETLSLNPAWMRGR